MKKILQNLWSVSYSLLALAKFRKSEYIGEGGSRVWGRELLRMKDLDWKKLTDLITLKHSLRTELVWGK